MGTSASAQRDATAPGSTRRSASGKPVIVLGAGIVGLCTAYALHQAGFPVLVVDRQDGPAQEASHANAGGLCPGFAGPWAQPGMIAKALRWMTAAHAPLTWRPRLSPRQWSWLLQFARHCSPAHFTRNKSTMQRIAHYSRDCLAQLRAHTAIAHDFHAGGVLQLLRTEQEAEQAGRAAEVLARFDVAHRLIGPNDILALEPALAHSNATFVGGLHLPQDETGDCFLFADGLAQWLRQQGVAFRFGTAVAAIEHDRHGVSGLRLASGERLPASTVVVAAGCHAPQLLRPLGIRLPIYPVKGYSITLDIETTDAAPRACVMDEHTKVMVTRLGNRLRAAGIAEISDYGTHADPGQCGFVRDAARLLFPDAGDYTTAQGWCGLRPMTPDGPGYLGDTPVRHLYLACGQGSNGWTQAAGVGRIVADLVAGKTPQIDLAGLTLANRYTR